ncbi:MAG: alpha/beta hydrolase-fold protein [Bacteroidota bacterium]
MKPYLFFIIALFSLSSLKAQQSTASGSVQTFTLYAPQYDLNKKIWIYLPQEYNKKNKKYPVVYMADGQNIFDKATSFSGEWRVDETLDSLQAKVIIVAIEHGGDQRLNELTPYKNDEYGGGGADVYLDFIMHTLKPHIDAYYRTKKDKEHTGIFGSSLGGLTAYYAAISYPDTFGMAGVFSPAFWINPEIFGLNDFADTLDAKIYFMAGDAESKDMVPDMERMAALATKNAKSAKFVTEKVVPGGQHNEALWAKEFAQAFLWLTKED